MELLVRLQLLNQVYFLWRHVGIESNLPERHLVLDEEGRHPQLLLLALKLHEVCSQPVGLVMEPRPDLREHDLEHPLQLVLLLLSLVLELDDPIQDFLHLALQQGQLRRGLLVYRCIGADHFFEGPLVFLLGVHDPVRLVRAGVLDETGRAQAAVAV